MLWNASHFLPRGLRYPTAPALASSVMVSGCSRRHPNAGGPAINTQLHCRPQCEKVQQKDSLMLIKAVLRMRDYAGPIRCSQAIPPLAQRSAIGIVDCSTPFKDETVGKCGCAPLRPTSLTRASTALWLGGRRITYTCPSLWSSYSYGT